VNRSLRRGQVRIVAGLALLALGAIHVGTWWVCDNTPVGDVMMTTVSNHLADQPSHELG